MLAFLVEIDGQRFTLAGAADWSVLTCDLTARRGRPQAQDESRGRDHVEVSVGGVSTPDKEGVRHYVRWGGRQVKVDSRVTVTVVEVDSADEPIKRFPASTTIPQNPYTEAEMREMRRRDYLELKKEFADEA